MSVKRLNKDKTVFAVIDIQKRLLPAMKAADAMEDTTVKLLRGARALGMEILVTQQYTKGIGPTTAEIAVAIEEFEPIEKTTFSAMKEPEFVRAIEAFKADTVVVCGIEAHICVEQTVLDLIEKGYNVFVPVDCVASRSKEAKETSLNRIARAGAVVTSYEAILFELMGSAGHPNFKEISKIIK